MEEDNNFNMIESSDELESEIRRLKQELIRQQYDQKILKLRSLIKSNQNKTIETKIFNTTNSNVTDYDLDGNEEIFGSVLFANVVGDFEVWHFVLLLLILWVILLMLINYIKNRINIYRARKKRKIRLQLLKQQIVKFNQNSIETTIDNIYETESICSYTSSNSSNSITDYSSSNLQLDNVSDNVENAINKNDNNCRISANFDFNFQLPKRDFFLYTIEEHSKKFNNKKFSIKRKIITNLSHLSSLSKSEPVLTKTIRPNLVVAIKDL